MLGWTGVHLGCSERSSPNDVTPVFREERLTTIDVKAVTFCLVMCDSLFFGFSNIGFQIPDQCFSTLGPHLINVLQTYSWCSVKIGWALKTQKIGIEIPNWNVYFLSRFLVCR